MRIETQGNVYCMDQREVSWGEYEASMTTKGGDTSGQPAECDWNTSFEPEYYPVDSGAEVDPTHKCPMNAAPTSDDVAAKCLDFCDALSYCESVGKRLCGRIGGPKWGRMNVGANSSAEKNAIAELAATSEMEFGYACTQASKSTYPYGDAYEPARCMDAEWVSQKGKDSLHSGAGPTTLGCLAIGSSFAQSTAEELACAGRVGFGTSKGKLPQVGVRCCADAVPI